MTVLHSHYATCRGCSLTEPRCKSLISFQKRCAGCWKHAWFGLFGKLWLLQTTGEKLPSVPPGCGVEHTHVQVGCASSARGLPLYPHPRCCLCPRVLLTSVLLPTGAAPGQCWLGEQPPTEAPRPPHLPGRADPPRDADQGKQQRGGSQGTAGSAAGESCGTWSCVRGWGWPECCMPHASVSLCGVCAFQLGALTAFDCEVEGGKQEMPLLPCALRTKQCSLSCTQPWTL